MTKLSVRRNRDQIELYNNHHFPLIGYSELLTSILRSWGLTLRSYSEPPSSSGRDIPMGATIDLTEIYKIAGRLIYNNALRAVNGQLGKPEELLKAAKPFSPFNSHKP